MGANTLSDTTSMVLSGVGARSLLLAPNDAPLEQRILAATLRCVSRWGVSKTTLDDIAREAGCSRATIYRVVPGGKDNLLMAAGEHELSAFFAHLASLLDQAESLADVLTVALSEAVRAIQHHEVLQYLLAHEPEVVLRHVSFDGLDPLLDMASAFMEPYLIRHLGDRRITRDTAEWLTRVVISYAFDPAEGFQLADPAVARHFIATYFLPGIDAQRSSVTELDLTGMEPPQPSTGTARRSGEPTKEHVQP